MYQSQSVGKFLKIVYVFMMPMEFYGNYMIQLAEEMKTLRDMI